MIRGGGNGRVGTLRLVDLLAGSFAVGRCSHAVELVAFLLAQFGTALVLEILQVIHRDREDLILDARKIQNLHVRFAQALFPRLVRREDEHLRGQACGCLFRQRLHSLTCDVLGFKVSRDGEHQHVGRNLFVGRRGIVEGYDGNRKILFPGELFHLILLERSDDDVGAGEDGGVYHLVDGNAFRRFDQHDVGVAAADTACRKQTVAHNACGGKERRFVGRHQHGDGDGAGGLAFCHDGCRAFDGFGRNPGVGRFGGVCRAQRKDDHPGIRSINRSRRSNAYNR